MIEVMMLGILAALVKIAQFATVIPGVAMYAAGSGLDRTSGEGWQDRDGPRERS